MKTLHLICNAHIDPIWQWTEEEGISAVLSTFRSAANLLDEYDYIFCHNEALVYRFVETHDPELFERIRKAVKSGKWRIMGGWFLQPDCNMPAGESIVRQINAGKQYFTEKFGAWSTVAFNADPFGHSRGLVQILKKCGQEGYMFMRPYGAWQGDLFQLELPDECFVWEGYDGSRIKAVRTTSYSSPLGHAAEKIQRDAEGQRDRAVGLSLWGVGNHGGGPSRKDLADVAAYIASSAEEGIEVKHSSPEGYFADVAPTAKFDRSLLISMPGCYTSMSRVKRRHAELESALYFTEKLCAAAALNGVCAFPTDALKEAETDLLKSEFHDVLPGTVVASGERGALAMMDHGLHALSELRAKALFALYRAFPYAGGEAFPIAVFNPHPYEWRTNIECEFTLADQNYDENAVSHVTVVDEAGNILPAQTIKEEGNLNLDWRKRILFGATLKPFGVTWFGARVEFRAPEKTEKRSLRVEDADKCVCVDSETGLLKSVSWHGKEIFSDAFRPILYEDNADPWAMSKEQNERGLGENPRDFACVSGDGIFAGLEKVTVTEDGPLLTAVEALFEAGDSKIVNEYRIYKNQPYIDVNVRVFWREADRMLKLALPCKWKGKYIGQTAYGSEELFSDGRECVAQRFVGVESGEDFAVVLNSGVYGSSYRDGRIYLSLLRGAGYCVHPIGDRPLLKEKRFIDRIDAGEHLFSFRLAVCGRAEAERLAEEFCQKPCALNVFSSGAPERAVAELRLSNPDIVLKCLKQLADGRYVLRLFHNGEDGAETEVSLCGKSVKLTFGRFEVKTILYDGKFSESEFMLA